MSRALDVVTLTGEEYDDILYDAERYRFLRRKFAIVGTGDGAEFRALNLPRPTYIAPDPAAELDAAIDASVCRQCGHDNDAHDRQYGCAEDGCDCLTPNATDRITQSMVGDSIDAAIDAAMSIDAAMAQEPPR